jgi:DNA-binding MarR family transcriptional regulator
MVDWLVARGCVQRLVDPGDRRVVRVALTKSSREFYEATEKYIGEHVRRILSCLTDEEQAILFALIHKVVAALEEAEG